MAKWGKKLLGLAAIGGAVAGLVYYFKNNSSVGKDDEFYEDLEDEDFDLDEDLKPVSDREYVPLNPSKKSDPADTDAESEEPAAQKPPKESESSTETSI